jgi:glycosyltransferase involved in cell wall biosynthesis
MLHVSEAVQVSNAGVPVLIPAYMPGSEILVLVKSLLQLGAPSIVVVDDGSGAQFEERFRELASLDRVHVIRHAVNLGKGTALKAGLNHILVHTPGSIGAVTADADGQHHPEDIVRVAARLRQDPGALVMGVREFGPHVPWRSRMGNRTTRILMGLAIGRKLSDTQTGLRGIPASLIPHLLRLSSSGYEFELDMLLACKYQDCPIIEEPIRTIYLNGNRSSHFDPVLDSMRIYLLLFRFSIVSFFTAVVDNVVFAAAHISGGSIAQSQVAARIVAMTFNYFGARSVVFHSQQGHPAVLPKYVLLVFCSGVLSYILIQFLHFRIGMSVMTAKVLAEGVLFIANFCHSEGFCVHQARIGFPRNNRLGSILHKRTHYCQAHPAVLHIGIAGRYRAACTRRPQRWAAFDCRDRWRKQLLLGCDPVAYSVPLL